MSGRIEVAGIEHGDKVHLTGESWVKGGFRTDEVYEVDNVSFHRPVIYADFGTGDLIELYIVEPIEDSDFSVTKVEA